MIPFWQPRYVRRRAYRVMVRPTRQGEFLLFPDGWRKGGRGVILSRTLKNTLEASVWGVADGVFLGAVLLCLLLGFVVGLVMLPVMLVLLVAWGLFDARRTEARLAEVAAKGRPAALRLSRERYELEYASQVSMREYMALLASGGVIGVSGAVLLMAGVVAGDGVQVLVAMLLLPVGALGVWRGYTFQRGKAKAFRHGVVAGDPIDLPLPIEESQDGILA